VILTIHLADHYAVRLINELEPIAEEKQSNVIWNLVQELREAIRDATNVARQDP
jgi:hypothetical protein